jgi:hypothetical protein
LAQQNRPSVPSAGLAVLFGCWLNYAARGLDKPLADLPADFQQQLKTIGYECKPHEPN